MALKKITPIENPKWHDDGPFNHYLPICEEAYIWVKIRCRTKAKVTLFKMNPYGNYDDINGEAVLSFDIEGFRLKESDDVSKDEIDTICRLAEKAMTEYLRTESSCMLKIASAIERRKERK